jgi:hypothetical protein
VFFARYAGAVEPGSGVFGGAREYIRIGPPEIYWW